jgi:hypothetical protein
MNILKRLKKNLINRPIYLILSGYAKRMNFWGDMMHFLRGLCPELAFCKFCSWFCSEFYSWFLSKFWWNQEGFDLGGKYCIKIWLFLCNRGSKHVNGEDCMTTFGDNNNKFSFHYTIVFDLQTYFFDVSFFHFDLNYVSLLY